MKQKLIDFLICPTCRKSVDVKIRKKRGSEIIDGLIKCRQCNDVFKITKGIPRFVVDDTKDFVKTEYAFSEKWKKHHKNHQKKDWVDFQRKWFLDRYGWGTKENFDKFLESKNMILDAGTGIGNSAKFLSTNKKSEVIALDASESIDFAYEKYGKLPNVHFLQADLRQLPFKKSFFDYIYSDQVLHHTKNTGTSFKYLTKFLQLVDISLSMFIIKKLQLENMLMIIFEIKRLKCQLLNVLNFLNKWHFWVKAYQN